MGLLRLWVPVILDFLNLWPLQLWSLHFWLPFILGFPSSYIPSSLTFLHRWLPFTFDFPSSLTFLHFRLLFIFGFPSSLTSFIFEFPSSSTSLRLCIFFILRITSMWNFLPLISCPRIGICSNLKITCFAKKNHKVPEKCIESCEIQTIPLQIMCPGNWTKWWWFCINLQLRNPRCSRNCNSVNSELLARKRRIKTFRSFPYLEAVAVKSCRSDYDGQQLWK